MATHVACLPPPAHDSLDDFVDRKCRRIEHLRIRRRNQWSDRAICIARIPLRKISGKGAQISTDSFFYQLLIAPLGTDFRTRCQENLERRVWKNNSTDVAPVGHQARRSPEGALPREKRLTYGRHAGHLGGSIAHRLVPDMLANLLV